MKRFIIFFIIIASLLSVLSYYLLDKGQLYKSIKPLAEGKLSAIEIYDNPKIAPLTLFEDREGNSLNLTDMAGKTVLVNFWATWCVPCLVEMPSLNRLQKAMGSDEFAVITISIDRQGYEVIDQFFNDMNIDALPAYLDHSNKLSLEVGAVGLPTSILLDKNSKIVARVVGPLEWDSENVMNFLDAAIKAQN